MLNWFSIFSLLSFLLSILISSSFAVIAEPIPCPPTDREVGVTVGDWFKYGDINVSWSSNDPNATFRWQQFKQMNETEWELMSIQNISCTWVLLQIVKHFKDGTEKSENGSVNIETGVGIMCGRVISANLNANDTIYTGTHFSTWRIDETIVRTYPDGERETNHLNMTQNWNITRYMDSWTINGTGHGFTNYYWDRSTGILVECQYEETEQVGEYLTTLSASYRIIESNVWVVPEFPAWTSTLLILIVLTVSIVLSRRKIVEITSKYCERIEKEG